jgi:hypothetical protein
MSSTSSGGDPASALDTLRAEIRLVRADGVALRGIFERLVLEMGRSEASRLWLSVFSESDASET